MTELITHFPVVSTNEVKEDPVVVRVNNARFDSVTSQ